MEWMKDGSVDRAERLLHRAGHGPEGGLVQHHVDVGDHLAADLGRGDVPFDEAESRPSGGSDEIAHLAVAIIENDYINGECIRMDGGIRMPPR